MRKVLVSKQVTQAFSRRIREISQVNPMVAQKLIVRYEEILRLLAEFPDITERGRKKGTRKISMPPFILMSRRKGEDIEIYAIRHARQRDALAPRQAAVDAREG